jgi:hypothetical protein
VGHRGNRLIGIDSDHVAYAMRIFRTYLWQLMHFMVTSK